MITFNNLPSELQGEQAYLKPWLKELIRQHGFVASDIAYFFCNDEELLKINQEFLQHDTYTDIVTFDYGTAGLVSGEIHISEQRVRDNATELHILPQDEFLRVVAHGVLHLCGFKDKTDQEAAEMRRQEEAAMGLFKNVKHR
ncbi:MAG: rRNA maturation RNase YbeY [Bacteroidales bacterium]|nr:rRNA maturation RNase YbeY [Bacteroidales bacterium]